MANLIDEEVRAERMAEAGETQRSGELPAEGLDLEGERGGGGGWGSREIELDLEEEEGGGGWWEREEGLGLLDFFLEPGHRICLGRVLGRRPFGQAPRSTGSPIRITIPNINCTAL